MTPTQKVKVNLTKERETKNKVRYREAKGDVLGTLYLSKLLIEEMGNPENLTVTIEAK